MPRYYIHCRNKAGDRKLPVYCWADNQKHAEGAITSYCGLLDLHIVSVQLSVYQNGTRGDIEPDFRTQPETLPKEVTSDV